MKIKIALNTKSKDKIDIFESFMGIQGGEYEIKAVDKSEGQSKVIVGEEELVKGALKKSLGAFESGGVDWAVAMEGGFCEIMDNLYLTCIVCIRTEAGSFLGISSKIRIPGEIESSVKRGTWVGDVLDKYQDGHGNDEYTNELCQMIRTRRELFTQSLSNALMFLRHDQEINK